MKSTLSLGIVEPTFFDCDPRNSQRPCESFCGDVFLFLGNMILFFFSFFCSKNMFCQKNLLIIFQCSTWYQYWLFFSAIYFNRSRRTNEKFCLRRSIKFLLQSSAITVIYMSKFFFLEVAKEKLFFLFLTFIQQ